MTQRSDLADRVANYSLRVRQLQKLSTSRRRLRRGAAYASAAGAALAGVSAAEATIVWSGANRNLMVQIDGNGAASFQSTNLNSASAPIPVFATVKRANSGVSQIAGFGQFSSGFRFAGTTFGYAPINFPMSANITATQFGGFRAIVADEGGGNNFSENEAGFLGFSFLGNKGWIKVRWEEVATGLNDGKPDKITAIEWAYENSGGPILAGQTPVPEAGSAALVGLVACGSAGVMALKKLRRAG